MQEVSTGMRENEINKGSGTTGKKEIRTLGGERCELLTHSTEIK